MKKIFFIFILISFLFANDSGIIIYNSFEVNDTTPQAKKNTTNFIFLNPSYNIETLKDSFKSIKPKLNIAVVVDKKILKKYLPSLINSINTYFLNKNLTYHIKIFDKTQIKTAAKNYKNIMIFSVDVNKTMLNEYNSTNFYFPAINKEDINFSTSNSFFGGINYKNQINSLSDFVTDNEVIAINSDTMISQKLLKEEEKKFNVIPMKYTNINYDELENKFIFFNTAADKTAKILSIISNKDINTKLNLASQIDFNPLLIALTQPEDVKKMIIANSILNVPLILEDYNQILNSDIRFNWLNYSTNILLNKIYNLKTNQDEFYMNDFDTYIFDNQIDYKTKIYQIINNSFREVY